MQNVSNVFFFVTFAAEMEQIKKVVDTAWGMFRRFGVRSVSMDDVAREMSISKKTLYRCFRDKNELITKTLDHDLKSIQTEVDAILSSEANPVRQVLLIATFVSQYLKETNPSMIYDLQKYHSEIYYEFIQYRDKTFMERVMGNLNKGVAEGYYRSNLKPEVIARLYLCLMNHGPEHLQQMSTSEDYSEMYIDIMQYHLHSIATEKGLNEVKEFLK